MSQIEELQSRITAAIDRIGRSLETLADNKVDTAELDALRQALEDEKLVGTQLGERIKKFKNHSLRLENRLEAARQRAGEAMKKFDSELQALRATNSQLRENNAKLREANEAGVAEPDLINKAMKSELEGLRATQSADRAETEAVFSELSSIIDNLNDNDQSENA